MNKVLGTVVACASVVVVAGGCSSDEKDSPTPTGVTVLSTTPIESAPSNGDSSGNGGGVITSTP